MAILDVEPPVTKNTPEGLLAGSLVIGLVATSSWNFACTMETSYDECKRFITNGTYMFAHVDINDDYACSQSEVDANIKQVDGGGGPAWDTNKANKYYCIKVDEEQPQLVTLGDCTGADLTEDAFTIPRYHRSMVEGYHAPKLLLKKPEGANPEKFIYLEANNGGGNE